MQKQFTQFLKAYPLEAKSHAKLNGHALAQDVQHAFGLAVPKRLVDFWNEVGQGYFGNRELYLFGKGSNNSPRDSLVEWNSKDFWSDFFTGEKVKPLFFAETCYGYQLGFQELDGAHAAVLFAIDTFKVYAVAEPFDLVFTDVLGTKHSLIESDEQFEDLATSLGPLPDGMHYAPILSPLVGGTLALENFHLETPNVHFRTAMATYQALHSPPTKPRSRKARKKK